MRNFFFVSCCHVRARLLIFINVYRCERRACKYTSLFRETKPNVAACTFFVYACFGEIGVAEMFGRTNALEFYYEVYLSAGGTRHRCRLLKLLLPTDLPNPHTQGVLVIKFLIYSALYLCRDEIVKRQCCVQLLEGSVFHT